MIIIITFVLLNENDYHFCYLLLLRSICNKQQRSFSRPRQRPGVKRSSSYGVPAFGSAHHGRWTLHAEIFRNIHVSAPRGTPCAGEMWKHVPAA